MAFGMIFQPVLPLAVFSNAIIQAAYTSKRVTVRRRKQRAHGLGLKSRQRFTRVVEGAPKVFR